MHIAIVTALYPPEPMVSATIAADLAFFLYQLGHKVTVLCPQPSRPMTVNYSGYRSNIPLRNTEAGIEVIRLPSFSAPRSSITKRLAESLSFGFSVCSEFERIAPNQPDVLFVNAWPMAAQFLIARYCYNRKLPVVMQIMDVYPESFVNRLHPIVRSLFFKPLRALDKTTVSYARFLSVISESMRQLFVTDRDVRDDQVFVIPTWQDELSFSPSVDRTAAFRRYGVSAGPITFLYLGNIGPVAGVEFLIDGFVRANLQQAQLVIAGDGSKKASCIDLSNRLGARNIYFVSDPDVSSVSSIQSMADVCLLPMQSGSGTSSIPSKLSAYMFSAKPILATVDADSDTARAIEAGKCGWVGKAEDLEWLVRTMTEITTIPANLLEDLGRAGKQYALANYSKSVNLNKLAELTIGAGKSSVFSIASRPV